MPRQHRDFLPVSLSVFALVLAYGVLNDQAIAAISPLHFALYHPHYFPFANVHLQALCFALVATGGPGLAWGILLYWVSNYGLGPVVRRRAAILGAAAVVLGTALAAWGIGWREWTTNQPPYPTFFFPSDDPRLNFSQTVQLTNYIAGFLGAAGWLLAIFCWRQLQVKAPPQT
jgi:hypothetical protein